MVFAKALSYLTNINETGADELDKIASELLHDEDVYERASQALRRRFVRGAHVVFGIDRGGRLSRIRREKQSGGYVYFIEGADGSWTTPEERIWVVAMYALWQSKNTKQ
jgi:hypothetical protein